MFSDKLMRRAKNVRNIVFLFHALQIYGKDMREKIST